MASKWTDRERKRAREMWLWGNTATEIGRALGRSGTNVCAELRRQGITPRRRKLQIKRPGGVKKE